MFFTHSDVFLSSFNNINNNAECMISSSISEEKCISGLVLINGYLSLIDGAVMVQKRLGDAGLMFST